MNKSDIIWMNEAMILTKDCNCNGEPMVEIDSEEPTVLYLDEVKSLIRCLTKWVEENSHVH